MRTAIPRAPKPVLPRPHYGDSTNILSFNNGLLRVHHVNNFIIHPKSILSVNFSSSTHGASSAAGGESLPQLDPQLGDQQNMGFWRKWAENSGAMRSKLAKLGLAAVLAYGLFDGVTYTSFFALAFLGYEKTTGNNPAANLKALLGIVILMWTGNNVTRPFRVAGAAALAPAIDEGLRRIQKYFNFPNVVLAFALLAGIVATTCLIIVSLLILSRWGK